jgi:hypothetical protein
MSNLSKESKKQHTASVKHAKNNSKGERRNNRLKRKGSRNRHASHVIQQHCARLRPLLDQMIVTHQDVVSANGKIATVRKYVTKKFDAFKRGYFLVGKDEKLDPKTLEKENDMLVRELELAIETVRAGLGNSIIRIKSAMDFGLTATVTSGVVNTVTCGTQTDGSIRLEDTHDFTALSTMFDEVRTIGGKIVFCYNNQSKAIGTAVDANSIPLIAWAPTAITAFSGVVAATQTAQHKFLGIAPTAPTVSTLHEFEFKLPPGDGVALGSVTVNGFRSWMAISDVLANNVIAGQVGFIHVGTVATATKIGAGVLILDMEFRCRA